MLLVKTETLYLFMLCPAHVSAREPQHVLTMAPRIRNKKKTKRITSPMQTGDDFGRPPGSATTIAGPSLAPMPVPNQHWHSPRYHNDDGATNIMCATQTLARWTTIHLGLKSLNLTTNQRIIPCLLRKQNRRKHLQQMKRCQQCCDNLSLPVALQHQLYLLHQRMTNSLKSFQKISYWA